MATFGTQFCTRPPVTPAASITANELFELMLDAREARGEDLGFDLKDVNGIDYIEDKDGEGSPEDVMEFIERLAVLTPLTGHFVMHWAETSSRHRRRLSRRPSGR